ncbi:hypothetical protein A4X06_0g8454 [Tilletia controversa]|uniref:Uncharacterized protein n=2 Tax=Tilletia TaxID=13289 RepID=A0A8X7MK43_9BASI|nr:hypothetical protein CF335_g7547 [Tilletia laevis]KAE8239204.1 hypothetical protein A4X06_0g8454 [Tilletia controversa]CAD6911994.1 unnamed protein product [Tilletia caries]CAD7064938.1 unnamed protein product [Tilletia caries]
MHKASNDAKKDVVVFSWLVHFQGVLPFGGAQHVVPKLGSANISGLDPVVVNLRRVVAKLLHASAPLDDGIAGDGLAMGEGRRLAAQEKQLIDAVCGRFVENEVVGFKTFADECGLRANAVGAAFGPFDSRISIDTFARSPRMENDVANRGVSMTGFGCCGFCARKFRMRRCHFVLIVALPEGLVRRVPDELALNAHGNALLAVDRRARNPGDGRIGKRLVLRTTLLPGGRVES